MTPEMMDAMQMAALVAAFSLFVIALTALFILLALAGLYRVLDEMAGDISGIRIGLESIELYEEDDRTREKPPDNPQAPADETSRAPMVRMAADRLNRRRSEAMR